MEEIWKDVVGFEGRYKVSSLGRIKSLKREIHCSDGRVFTRKEMFFNNINTVSGYYTFSFHKEGRLYTRKLHRIIAEAFIPNPENKPYINHKNCVRTDNRIENLEWCTHKENMQHAFASGSFKNRRPPSGDKNGQAKLKNSDIPVIRKMLSEGMKQKDIALIYGINPTQISQIKHRREWASVE